ncbi:MAG: glycoside hydrolase family 127 protein [Sedimentisphaerales bacterium]|nr:glycoside hydrolase family 127 protein [Sedimentisphaerales bacterium]
MVRKTLVAAVLMAAACRVCNGEFGREKIEFKARPFSLKQVRLLDGPFKENMERTRKYLHELDSDRLLHTFRLNAGLPSSAEPLGGWESPSVEVRGHIMGHYLSACAMMYASTSDEKLKAKADVIVAELGKCQKALGNSGYLSAFPETFIDRVESLKGVWAPYYTLHKIYAGLIDMYVHCGNIQALEIAEKMAAWNKVRLDKIDRVHMQKMLNQTEQGGMNEAFANLYALTGRPDYLAMSRRFNQDRYTEPLARGEDRLKSEHVNSFIPNIIGTARQYELAAEPRDRKIAEYFWSQVVNHRSYCTGGTSNNEHWRSDPDQLAVQLGDHTQESCCTYNMLKLTRQLFTWNAETRYADYYERALYNSILSTQNPRTGMMMYFVPLASGRWKMYNLPYDSFWCCTGTGLENHAKYGDSIYFHNGDTLFVNLFIASELDWKQQGVRIRQETAFPEQGVYDKKVALLGKIGYLLF